MFNQRQSLHLNTQNLTLKIATFVPVDILIFVPIDLDLVLLAYNHKYKERYCVLPFHNYKGPDSVLSLAAFAMHLCMKQRS